MNLDGNGINKALITSDLYEGKKWITSTSDPGFPRPLADYFDLTPGGLDVLVGFLGYYDSNSSVWVGDVYLRADDGTETNQLPRAIKDNTYDNTFVLEYITMYSDRTLGYKVIRNLILYEDSDLRSV